MICTFLTPSLFFHQLNIIQYTDPPVVATAEHPMLKRSAATATEDTDFDAPVLNNPAFASGPLDHEIVVDDECYMGKDGQLDECADFGKINGEAILYLMQQIMLCF